MRYLIKFSYDGTNYCGFQTQTVLNTIQERLEEALSKVNDKPTKIVATGRSDFSNQINNSLVFPGLFRGVIDSKIKKITDEIKLLAATSLAESVLPSELEENYIIPDALDKDVAKNISACIINHVRKS